MDKINIYSRSVWSARPATRTKAISTPTPELWLHHSAGALDAGTNEKWADDVNGIQDYHLDVKGWSDIAYSFLADDSGQLWTGRGEGIQGAHTGGHNTKSHGICAIGNYEVTIPSFALLEALANLVAHGYLEGWWSSFISGPHSDVAATACCGKNLEAKIPAINQRAQDLIDSLTSVPVVPTLEERVAALEVRVEFLEDWVIDQER